MSMDGVTTEVELVRLRERIADVQPDPVIPEQAIPAALQHGAWRGEATLPHPSGRVIPVSQVLLAHFDRDGRPLYLSTVARDITERQQVEQALRQSIAQEEVIRALEAAWGALRPL